VWSTSGCCLVEQRPGRRSSLAAHRAGIVRHVAGIAGPPGSPRSHADRRYRGRDVGTVEAALASGLETARTILAAYATP
jgi:hypothetical protein